MVKTEEKVEKVEEKPAKVEEKVEVASVEVSAVPEQVSIAPGVSEVVKLIKETDAEKINKVLQIVNVSIMKKYSFALSQDDSVEELSEKLSKFPNIEQFKKTLLNFIG